MNESDKTFREKLLDMEKPNASYKKQYEMEVLAMVEMKLQGTILSKMDFGFRLYHSFWYDGSDCAKGISHMGPLSLCFRRCFRFGHHHSRSVDS